MLSGARLIFKYLVLSCLMGPAFSWGSPCSDFFTQFPEIRQETEVTCGPAALASVLKHFDITPPPEHELARRLNTTFETGTGHYSLERVVREFGLTAKVKHGIDLASVEKYLATGKAVIALIQAWGDLHWIVVERVDRRHVYFMDPYGPNRHRKMTRSDFLEAWKNPETERLNFESIVIGERNPIK